MTEQVKKFRIRDLEEGDYFELTNRCTYRIHKGNLELLRGVEPKTYWQIKGPKNVKGYEMSILRKRWRLDEPIFKVGDFVTDSDEYLKVVTTHGPTFSAFNHDEHCYRYDYHQDNFKLCNFENLREGQEFYFKKFACKYKKQNGKLVMVHGSLGTCIAPPHAVNFSPDLEIKTLLPFKPTSGVVKTPPILSETPEFILSSKRGEVLKAISKKTSDTVFMKQKQTETKMTKLYQTIATPHVFGTRIATTDQGKLVLQLQDGSGITKEFDPSKVKPVQPYTVQTTNLSGGPSYNHSSYKGQVKLGQVLLIDGQMRTVTGLDTKNGEGHKELEGQIIPTKPIK